MAAYPRAGFTSPPAAVDLLATKIKLPKTVKANAFPKEPNKSRVLLPAVFLSRKRNENIINTIFIVPNDG